MTFFVLRRPSAKFGRPPFQVPPFQVRIHTEGGVRFSHSMGVENIFAGYPSMPAKQAIRESSTLPPDTGWMEASKNSVDLGRGLC